MVRCPMSKYLVFGYFKNYFFTRGASINLRNFSTVGAIQLHLRNHGRNYSCRKHNVKEKKPCSAEYCF